jgi:hypothetical protein
MLYFKHDYLLHLNIKSEFKLIEKITNQYDKNSLASKNPVRSLES